MSKITLLPSHPDYIASENEKDVFLDACLQTFKETLHKRNQDNGELPNGTVSNETLIEAHNLLDQAYEKLKTVFEKAHRSVPEEQENMYQVQKKLISAYADTTPT